VAIDQSDTYNTCTCIKFKPFRFAADFRIKRGHTSDKNLPISNLLHVKENTKQNVKLITVLTES